MWPPRARTRTLSQSVWAALTEKPWTEGLLSDRKWFPTVLEVGKFTIKMLTDWGLVRTASCFTDSRFLAVAVCGGRGRGFLWGLF